jgi:hypothetical protein
VVVPVAAGLSVCSAVDWPFVAPLSVRPQVLLADLPATLTLAALLQAQLLGPGS